MFSNQLRNIMNTRSKTLTKLSMEARMLKKAGIEAIKAMGPGPVGDGLPVCALVHALEVGPRPAEIGDPVERLKDDVGIAHDVFPKAIETVICRCRLIIQEAKPVETAVDQGFVPMCWSRFFSVIL